MSFFRNAMKKVALAAVVIAGKKVVSKVINSVTSAAKNAPEVERGEKVVEDVAASKPAAKRSPRKTTAAAKKAGSTKPRTAAKAAVAKEPKATAAKSTAAKTAATKTAAKPRAATKPRVTRSRKPKADQAADVSQTATAAPAETQETSGS